jgi:hydroxymethylbilane synthase
VKAELQKAYPLLKIELLGMTTQADRMPYVSLAEMGGKGLFVKELEEALLDGRADIAVHSVKDVPMLLPKHLAMTVFCQRETPFDAFVSNDFKNLLALPRGAVVGSSSLRRQSQLLNMRPDLNITKLRGNINTRLKKLDAGEYAAIILAAAGLKRLDFHTRIAQVFSPQDVLPAVGQGVLGIECRENDSETLGIIKILNHVPTYLCVSAERAMCRHLQAGCQTPVGAYARIEEGKIILNGLVASPDGKTLLKAEYRGTDTEQVGRQVGEALWAQGAEKILKACELPHAK